MGIILAIILFSIIVFVHELGHFLLAKKNGMDVSEFSLGMGPRLWSRQMGDTRYSLKLFPIGGSCAMGEDDLEEDMQLEDLPPSNFNRKPVWARISVILAGPVFNFITAFLFSVVIVAVVGFDAPVIRDVVPESPAQAAGLMPGDRIVKLNRTSIHIFREISMFNQFADGEPVEVTYVRDGVKSIAVVAPVPDETGRYLFGITSAGYEKGTAIQALTYGAYEVKFWISATLSGLRGLVTGVFGVEELSGPVGIVTVVDDVYQETKSGGFLDVLINMLNIAILLSANLGVMNLLPLPALDGGRLVFLFAEAITRKRVPPSKEGVVHFIGFVLLIGLMVVVLFNDIKRLL